VTFPENRQQFVIADLTRIKLNKYRLAVIADIVISWIAAGPPGIADGRVENA